MSLLSVLGISTAQAATTTSAATPQHGSILSMLPMLLIFVVAFYFLLVRPQSKRAKEQRQLMNNLTIGDEVITAGGIAGRITKLRDNYAVLLVGKEVEMVFQKSSVASVLPKGTLESIAV